MSLYYTVPFLRYCTSNNGVHGMSNVGIAGGLEREFNPHLMSSPPPPQLRLFICLVGSDETAQIAKMSKILNFIVNTWVFKAQNAPKPVFARGSASDPLGSLRRPLPISLPSTPSVSRSRRLRRLASDTPPPVLFGQFPHWACPSNLG